MSRMIMIDLETFGSAPGCSIASIGAVAASHDGFVQDTLYEIVSRSSCAEHGLHESTETLRWWSEQSAEAQAVLTASSDPERALSLRAALRELNSFVKLQGSDIEVFGNGSDFDNAILAAAAHAAGVELAWPFWQNRCYRTNIMRRGTHHNALDDARDQAAHLGFLRRAQAIDSDKIALGAMMINWMARHYRYRTSQRILGLRIPTMSKQSAIDHARATFDANLFDMPLGHPDFAWDQEGAEQMVNEDLQHWEAA
jgi:hypothetical protein